MEEPRDEALECEPLRMAPLTNEAGTIREIDDDIYVSREFDIFILAVGVSTWDYEHEIMRLRGKMKCRGVYSSVE